MSDAATLVVGPAWVGDMVMAQTLFKLLKSQSPTTQLDVVAPNWSLPLVERMSEVRTAHALAAGHGQLALGERRRLGRSLRGRYARAIVLPRSFKAALVPFHANIARRTGYRGEMRFGLLNDRRPLDKTRLPTTVARYAALAYDSPDALPDNLPFPSLRSDSQRGRDLCAALGLATGVPTVALFPGAEYGPAKQWSAQRFATLAQGLTQAGVQVWVMGSQKEHALGAQICADGGDNLCGRTQLADVVDLMSLAEVVVSNDSGLMHIGAAVGCQVVAIYGSSSAAFTPPLTARATIVQKPQPCSPCFARTCRFGHYRCLTDIDTALVRGHVDRLLAAQ